MMKLDSFFDTYEKRIHVIYLIYLFSSITFSITHIVLGVQLLKLTTYEDVLNLVHIHVVNQSFFGRNALFLLNLQILDPIEYLFSMIQSLKFYEIIYIMGSILCLFTRKKKTGRIQLLIWISIFIMIVVIYIFAFQSSSLYQVLSYLKGIGIGLFFLYGISFLFSICEVFKTIKGYREALEYEVIIIE